MKSIYCLIAIVIFAGLLQAQSMHGTVTDAVTGKPIRGATVTVVEISKTFTTDNHGQYSTDSISAGTFAVRITAPKYLKFSRKAIVGSRSGAGISNLEFNAGLYNIASVADTSEGMVTITYQFPGHGDVEFVIQNADGKKIRKMYDRSRVSGKRSVSWNGKDDDGNTMIAGRYTCTVSSGRLSMVRTLIWKGAAQVQPEKVMPPPAVSADSLRVQATETPAAPPSPPAQDTDTTKVSPAVPAE
jgi:hypothetical protein